MIRSLTLSIAVSYLKARRRQTIISLLGVSMGVGFFIAVSAMMQGLQTYFIEQIVDIAPHVIVMDEYRKPPLQPAQRYWPDSALELRGLKPREELRGIRGGYQILSEIKRMPGVKAAPVLRGQAFLRYGSKELAISVIGLNPEDEMEVSHLERDVVSGSLKSLMTNSNGIIVGSGVLEKLGARMGSKLVVVSPRGVSMIMKIVGVSRTGITTMDYSEAYILLEKSEILQQRNRRINQIKLRLDNIDNAESIAAEIEQRFGWRAEGWQETNENVFGLFRVQNLIMYSVVGAILIVAGFGIYNIISTVVTEKTRDIAILKSIGFGRRDVIIIFVAQGLMVGILGTVVGWGLGWAMTEGLSHVPFDMGDKGFISVNHLILHRSTSQYVMSGIFAILASIISSVLPARKAANVYPVDIIRGAT